MENDLKDDRAVFHLLRITSPVGELLQHTDSSEKALPFVSHQVPYWASIRRMLLLELLSA